MGIRENNSFRPSLSTQSSNQFIDNIDLPSEYGVTRIVLLVKDPSWLYSYWEISRESLDVASNYLDAKIEDSKLIIRMYDVTCIDFNGSNANNSFDIEVGFQARSWYINLWSDSVSYCADLGIRTPSGQFYKLARSNFIQTPRSSIASKNDELWMEQTLNANAPSFLNKVKLPRVRASSATNLGKRRYALSESDIREYYSRMYPLLQKVAKTRNLKQNRIFKVHDNKVLFEDINIFRHPKIARRVLGGASEELSFPGASEREFSKSGASVFPKEAGKDFFFELGTELIVYGRTEPDAEVWFENKKIPLRKDGTFSLRFALPDGKIPLEFKAISVVKDLARSIATSVIRTKTHYSQEK